MIRLWRKRIRLWGRYTGASVVAGIISEVVFVVTYWFAAAPLVASLLAFVAGAVPNYLMNRYWAWQRRGRPDRTREILPYAVIVVVTARHRDSSSRRPPIAGFATMSPHMPCRSRSSVPRSWRPTGRCSC